MSKNKYEEQARELLDSITREELIQLLIESGLEVIENGTGKIIFTDKEEGKTNE